MTTIVLDLWLALSDVDRDADTLILLGKRHFIKLSLAANQALGMTRAEIPLKVGQRTFPKSLHAPGTRLLSLACCSHAARRRA